MAELSFDTGLKSYTVNGVEDAIQFNPTDLNFIQRLQDVFSRMEKLQTEYETRAEEDILEAICALDGEMRGVLDSLFPSPVPPEVWGGQNLFAFSSGAPLWCNFLCMLLDACEEGIRMEQAKVSPALERLKKKYGGK